MLNTWFSIILSISTHSLANAEKELAQVMSLLKEKQDKLAAVEAKIAELQKTYDDSVAEKQKLERNIATTAGRLKRSSKLTSALADEQVCVSGLLYQFIFKFEK